MNKYQVVFEAKIGVSPLLTEEIYKADDKTEVRNKANNSRLIHLYNIKEIKLI